jgi:internalin A
MEELGIGSNNISDISPLRHMKNLTHLSASNNQISNVTPLKSLINLRRLFLGYNKITDISSLRSLKNLNNLEGLIVLGNPIINKTCPFENKNICSF